MNHIATKCSRKTRYAWLILLITFPCLSSADLTDGEFHASLNFTSDFFWRGYSKSADSPSYQLNLDYDAVGSGSGFFAGAWAATIDFTDREFESASDYEFVLYLGWSQEITQDFRIDAQLSQYLYDDELFGRNSEYLEIYLFGHYQDLATFEVSYAPEAYGIGPDTWNYQFTARYPLLAMFEASAGIGYYDAIDLFQYDYWYWNVGATWRGEYLAVDLRYIGSSEVNVVELTGNNFWEEDLPFETAKVVITISVGF